MKVLIAIALVMLVVFIVHMFFDLKWSMYWIDKVYEHNLKCIESTDRAEMMSYDVVDDNSVFKFWDWRWYGMVDPVALKVLMEEK